MSIRFLADADLNRAIVEGCLREERAIDFARPAEAGLPGKQDPEVLAIAPGLVVYWCPTTSALCLFILAGFLAKGIGAPASCWYRRAFPFAMPSIP